jgi:regulatory LuxR family protein
VVRLMAAGETSYRIARLLGVSEATAKTHLKHVLAKLGAANRSEAVSRWLHLDPSRRPELVQECRRAGYGHDPRRGVDYWRMTRHPDLVTYTITAALASG